MKVGIYASFGGKDDSGIYSIDSFIELGKSLQLDVLDVRTDKGLQKPLVHSVLPLVRTEMRPRTRGGWCLVFGVWAGWGSPPGAVSGGKSSEVRARGVCGLCGP